MRMANFLFGYNMVQCVTTVLNKSFMSNHAANHPPSLRIYFATEMWERYGFYIVQSLLALYLVSQFRWADERIYALVGSFTALTYLSPVVGGWIADNLLGQKRSILLGAGILGLCYFTLAFIHTEYYLSLSLAGIAVGTGLLKPNISSLLGNEYAAGAPNRDSGFIIFYMGLNMGIILGTTLPSSIQIYLGWPAAFLSATFGLIIACAVFTYGIIEYRIKDYLPHAWQLKKILQAAIIMWLLWGVSFYILYNPKLADIFFSIVVLLSLAYLIVTALKERGLQRRQTLVILALCVISALFWAFYFQMFLSLTLFITRVVQPTFLGIHFSPPYYVAIQSVGLVAIGIYMAKKNTSLNAAQQGLTAGNKFLCAIMITSSAYGLIAFACQITSVSSLISPYYIITAYLMFSLAELLLSPIGLSAITVLASREKVSTVMGIFLVSLGIGGYLSGKLAKITAISDTQISLSLLKKHYTQGFLILFFFSITALAVCFLLNHLIKYLLRNYSGSKHLKNF